MGTTKAKDGHLKERDLNDSATRAGPGKASSEKATPAESKKRKSTDTNSSDSPPQKAQKTKTAGTSKTQSKAKSDKPDFNVSDIELPNEDPDTVEIYDTPAELRRKNNAHMKQPGVTTAGLCRQLSVTATSLDTFLKKKGRRDGNDSKVFPASYIFFEKLRLKQGKKKSKVREEMEQVWRKEGGMDRYGGAYFMHKSDGVSIDKYGKLEIVRGARR